MMSTSKSLRLKGNEFLKSATDDLAPVIWESRILQAVGKYQNAMDTAVNDDEKASAAKNYAVVSRSLAKFYQKRDNDPIKCRNGIHFFKEAARMFQLAYEVGFSVKSQDWVADINSKLQSLTEEVYEFANQENLGPGRASILETFTEELKDEHLRGECYLHIGQVYFKSAITAIEEKDFRRALYLLKESYRPVEEAKLCGSRDRNEYILSESRVLEGDVFLQTCIAESMQARSIGDDMLDKAITNYEDLPIPLIWDVMDWYKKANLLAQEQDVELEAIALAKLGRVYHRILKHTIAGRDLYKRALDLIATLHPRTFNTEDWYKECATGLADIQKESVLEEEKRRDEARKETMKLLEKEIKQLDKVADDAVDLLEFVYKEFPPINSKHQLFPSYKEAKKKALCLAVQHYHPDKVDADIHGFKKKVLCEEITKRLTRQYECFKL